MAIQSYDELAQDVRAYNGIRSYDMGLLRDIHGAGKLGTTVVQNISRELSRHGLGHYGELKLYQWEKVKIYDKSSMIGKIIEALDDYEPRSERFLQEISDARDRARAIERLKELVAEL